MNKHDGLPSVHCVNSRPWDQDIDDDSLLNMFGLYRPVLVDEDEEDERVGHECRWYRRTFAKYGDTSYWVQHLTALGSCLAYTIGTPVADMLAHSPPLPLIIDHVYELSDITAEDKKEITPALQQCDRI